MAKSIPPNDGEKPDDLVQQVLDHRAMKPSNNNQRPPEMPPRWHTIRLDPDVVEFYQATGEGWQAFDHIGIAASKVTILAAGGLRIIG